MQASVGLRPPSRLGGQTVQGTRAMMKLAAATMAAALAPCQHHAQLSNGADMKDLAGTRMASRDARSLRRQLCTRALISTEF